jgi:N-acetylmuramic acid 6-phosphate etherase
MNVETFLKLADQFKLGSLTTESMHPLTLNLSEKVKNNLQDALSDLKAVDLLALSRMESKLEKLVELHALCQNTLRQNKKIFLCGCGATGRLALTIEFLFRKKILDKNFNKDNLKSDQVVAFMAGGDFALIKSVESFEDRMSYGARQLRELGFSEGDLLLAITEGGETSFVIGAALEAVKISSTHPYH